MNTTLRALLGASLLLALGAGSPAVFAQQEQGRVISSSPIRTPDGVAGYSVTYEYAGRQYTTRTDSPPGKTIALQVTPMGVATSSVPDQGQYADDDGGQQAQQAPAHGSAAPWQNAVPEPGMVVGTGAPPVAYPPGYAPGYAYAPAPVYVAPAYGYGYGYGYGYPYGFPPVGVSLNLGYSYSHGWGGGGWHHGWH